MRTTFRIDEADIPRAVLWGRWDDIIEVFINGTPVARGPFWVPGYRYLGLDNAALIPGAANTLAIHVTNEGGGPGYLDLDVVLNELPAMPTSGFERTPALAAYTTAVRRLMHQHGIPGGVLAVMKRDQVVVKRAFGWADKNFTRPLSADAVMRLGAQDLLLTAGAVATLIRAGIEDPVTRERITRDTRVFPLLRAHGLTPLPGRTPAPEIDQVTVGMLLDFESGVSELTDDPAQLYADLGAAPGSMATAEDNVRWVYSVPPGRPAGPPAYDGSSGYMVLRHLVHVVTGDLLAFMRTSVFGPAGSSDVFIAHERLASRDAREPGYLTFEPPYDRWIYLDNCYAFATTAEAFVRYLRRYHASAGTLLLNPQTQQWEAPPYGGTPVLFGVTPGTWTMVVQRLHDEVSYVAFFNIAGVYDELLPELEAVTNRLSASDWGL